MIVRVTVTPRLHPNNVFDRVNVLSSDTPYIMNPSPVMQAIKGMSNNKKYCEPSIARVYAEHVRGAERICRPPPVSLDTCCIFTKVCKHYNNSDPVLTSQLKMRTRLKYDLDLDSRLWVVHRKAKISGCEFTSGESIEGVKRSSDDRMLRCGSIITLVSGGRSLYAWVKRFLSFDTIHLAHVRWLPIPEYPCANPFVVVLRNDGPIPDLACTVELTRVDPSRIAILHSEEDACMYPMRLTGIDTMPL